MFLISHMACGYFPSDKLLAWTLFSTGAKQWFLNYFSHTPSPLLSADDGTSDHLYIIRILLFTQPSCLRPSLVMKLQGVTNLHVCVHPAGWCSLEPLQPYDHAAFIFTKIFQSEERWTVTWGSMSAVGGHIFEFLWYNGEIRKQIYAFHIKQLSCDECC